ncbi:hypothetical protein [Micromonospora yangpuensis]|uniref:Uncharacterized protein n=1 Tax=Micromonospora yangpuensis TaxID=683228 RepID=A0A1C6V2Q3_9ACTN|nr:hypothetical protein [Micromonospora yangpuensis]GGL97785.1 hypothetical protein GCM10012279_14050 [Micromonospora yangpuensis]SCL60170.1 hypothetical protein GA0070617_4302 [Micromonospora yangpuensis]
MSTFTPENLAKRLGEKQAENYAALEPADRLSVLNDDDVKRHLALTEAALAN